MKKTLLALVMVTVLGGCAGVPVYKKIESALRGGKFEAAVLEVEKAKKDYSKRSRLVYYMDRLFTAHLANDFATSNRYVELSHKRIENLYTKSISGEAMSWVLNDSKKDYRGEHFERVMVHILGMLNYSMLGKPDEALVEARRADMRLKEYSNRYGDKLRYKDDALARWLSGAIYEAQGELSDAFIDYKKTLKAYEWYAKAYGTPTPSQAIRDTIRMADRLHEIDQARRLREKYPSMDVKQTPAYLNRKGEAIVLLYEGMAPFKVTHFWQVPLVHKDGREQIFKVAYPAFISREIRLQEAFVEDGRGKRTDVELFEDVDAIALKDLEDRMFKIKAKAIARATVKAKAALAVQKEAKNKVFAALATNLFTAITEQADTRSWRTLPGRIHVARLPLEPGKHDLKIVITPKRGSKFEKKFAGIEIKQGRQVFLKASVY